MRKTRDILRHITVILSFMFIVFLVLDIFNPMMNFVDNTISRGLLCGLCVSAILQSALSCKLAESKNAKRKPESIRKEI